jgi:hypothetical protein
MLLASVEELPKLSTKATPKLLAVAKNVENRQSAIAVFIR